MEPTERKARCANCRHGEHEGQVCSWESPGGDLVGQYCTCDEYVPCTHPPEKRGPNNYLGNPTCNGCAEHFKSEADYERARTPKFLIAPETWRRNAMIVRRELDGLDNAHRCELVAESLERYGVAFNLFGYPVAYPQPEEPLEQDELDEILDQFPTHTTLVYGRTEGDVDPETGMHAPETRRAVAVFQFSEKGFGFGEITIVQTKAGCFIDTECMKRETVKRFLCALVDGAVIDGEDDPPEKHVLYNQVMGRTCGGHCLICYPKQES